MNAFIINIIRELENSARKGEDKALIIALAEELITELKKLPDHTSPPENKNTGRSSYNVPMPPSRIKVELPEDSGNELESKPEASEPVFETTLQNDESGSTVEILEERLTREPPRYIESNFVSKIRPEEFKPEPIDPATISEEYVLPVTEEMMEEAMHVPEEENATEEIQADQEALREQEKPQAKPATDPEKDKAWKPQAEPASRSQEIAEKPVAEAPSKAAKPQKKPQPTQFEINDLFSKEEQGFHTLNPLGGMPVTDLRKAFNISEKYQLVEELFSRDETLFNRSIQTINQFESLPQAIFWIEKELRVRQGWQEEHPLVQFFYDVVRRRFS